MYLDKFDNPIFNDFDIFEFLYTGKIDQLSKLTVSLSSEIENFEKNSNIKFTKFDELISNIDISQFDFLVQTNWLMPDEYRTFDIKNWLYQQCESNIEILRIKEELIEFDQRNMINLLRWAKYFVDTCRKNKLTWGVGRGSSVASFVLYKIGIHKINSLLYDLDWREFLK